MKIWKDIEKFRGTRPVVTVGIFDGVHRGHRFLIDRLRGKAHELNGESVIITLWPHPRVVLNKDTGNLRYLNSIDEKKELLEQSGVDHLIILPFTKEFAGQDSCSFINNYLVKKLSINYLLVGFDHKFGKDREGDYERLKLCAKEYGFGIEQIAPREIDSQKISSSLIRELLLTKELIEANQFLGYNYFLKGKVTNGNQVGREIGFPTANIEPEDPHKLIPADGVYAVFVNINNEKHQGMLNIGYRPTMESNDLRKSIEVNIFNFDKNIYNEDIYVEFVARLRNEKKFQNIEQLTQQLIIDKQQALNLFNT